VAANEKRSIGNYELLETLGTGAEGQVYKAKCLKAIEGRVNVGDIVAVKVLTRSPSVDAKEELRFKRQVAILEQLEHPNICKYVDDFIESEGEFDERRCLVMEFIDGQLLTDRLKRYPRGFPWEEVRDLFTQCLEGLAHAAEQGVFHRDLKPSNLIITHDGNAKIIDFGIARQEGGEETSTGGWRGSFDYMAPDFVRQENFRGDEQSDIYSMGIFFYMALTGELPFERFGENAHIGYLNRWKGDDEPRPSFRHKIFRVLTRIKPFVLGCLNVDRDERYKTFREMLEGLSQIKFRVVRHKGVEDYELIDMLGRGGFGEVFKGRQASDGKLVAVKHLFAGRQASRFIKEAQFLQKYNHPDIVRYVDFIKVEGLGDDKEFFLVMEYLPGMPEAALNNRIRKAKTGIEAAEVIELFIHYLSALQFLHENSQPIIHRDIRPGNLYAPLDQSEKAKIFDLGVARDVSGTLTTGMIPGTLDYMAPEFAKPGSGRGSAQSDLYALGVSMYESLTGKKPYPRFPKADQEAFVQFVARAQNPPPVDYSHPAFKESPDLEQIIRQSIDTNPRKRFDRCAEMLEELEKVMGLIAREDDDFDDESTRLFPLQTIDISLDRSEEVIGEKDTEFADHTRLVDVSEKNRYSAAIKLSLVLVKSNNASNIGQRCPIDDFPFMIGRSAEANFRIMDDSNISKIHAEIQRSDIGYTVVDHSKNGCYLDGRRIRSTGELLNGSILALSAQSSIRIFADLPEIPSLVGHDLDHRYRMSRKLHGSIKAAIYEAQDLRLGRNLAIKVFSPFLNDWKLYREEFTRRAEIAATLDHPSICKILDYGQAELVLENSPAVLPYICMQFLSGGNLNQRLEESVFADKSHFTSWLNHIANAIVFAHGRGFVHGGLKPGAIIYDKENRPYLTDFALAGHLKDREQNRTVTGVPAFLAPEQWDGQGASERSDQFSLAALAYLLLAGQHPFEGQELPEVRKHNFERGAEPVHRAAARHERPDVPKGVSKVLAKAMAVDPKSRYDSVGEFADDLKQEMRSQENAIVFVSYRRGMAGGWAQVIANRLEKNHHISTFIDTNRMDGAGIFPKKLEIAVQNCAVFVCLLSEDVGESEWVRKEIELAMRNHRPIVPVFTESYLRARDTQAAHLSPLHEYEGVQFDERYGAHIEYIVMDLARIIRQTIDSEDEVDDQIE
jgi:serine/threonine protein kinase